MKDYFKALLSNNNLINLNNNKNTNILYVIDANYLLYSVQTSVREHYYLEALKKNINNLYIPFNVYIEFLSSFQLLVLKTREFLKNSNLMLNLVNEISKVNFDDAWLQNILLNKLEEFSQDNSEENHGMSSNSYNTFVNHDSYKKDLQPKIENAISAIAKQVAESLQKLNADIHVAADQVKTDSSSFDVNSYDEKIKIHLAKLNSLFNHANVLGAEYSQSQIDTYENKIDSRYEENIPPGYKDKVKDRNNEVYRYFGNLKIKKSHGDAILWLDLIDFVSTHSEYDKVVFVSDDSKEDWVVKGNSTKLRPELVIEFLQETGMYIEKISTEQFISEFTDITDIDKEQLKVDIEESNFILQESETAEEKKYFKDYSRDDTIVVPARSDGFNKVFLGENQWYSIKIFDGRRKFLKYIAVYRTYPYSQITHVAKIKEIVISHEDPTKKKIIFEEPAKKLEKPIPLGDNPNAMQSSRYTRYEKIFESKNIDELFSNLDE